MKIAQLAPLWKEVPPPKYGGTELVVNNLVETFTKMGHEVTLFACGGSVSAGKLVEVIPKSMYDLNKGFSWGAIQAYEFLQYYELFSRIDEFDIIHNHLGFHPVAFAPLLKKPIVTTWHSSAKPDFPYLAQKFSQEKYVSISNAQRKLAPYLNYIETIYHGINTSAFESRLEGEGDYLFFIGSLTKNKGIDLAIQAARDLNQKLIIAGEIRAEDRLFLKKTMFPYVDGENIRFVGEVGHAEKAKLYKGAKATLFPTRWNEAFGLVMVESLACGTPVIAYGNGSVPEVLREGVTGFIVNNFDDFKKKIGEIPNLSRSECLKDARERFDMSIMGEKYIKLFESLIKNNK